MTLEQVASWWSDRPSKLAGLHSKVPHIKCQYPLLVTVFMYLFRVKWVFKLQGAIAVGKHADIVVWEPEVEFDLDEDHPIHFKHPVCTVFFFFFLTRKRSISRAYVWAYKPGTGPEPEPMLTQTKKKLPEILFYPKY